MNSYGKTRYLCNFPEGVVCRWSRAIQIGNTFSITPGKVVHLPEVGSPAKVQNPMLHRRPNIRRYALRNGADVHPFNCQI